MSRQNAAAANNGVAPPVRRESRRRSALNEIARAGEDGNIRRLAVGANARPSAPLVNANVLSPAPICVIPRPPQGLNRVSVSAPRTVPPDSNSSNASSKRSADSAFGVESVESWASTHVEQDTFAFLWTLNGYTGLASGCEEVVSPAFKGGSQNNHTWQLKVTPKKKVEEQEFFAVHLVLLGFGDNGPLVGPGPMWNARFARVRFQLSFLDAEGRVVKDVGNPGMKVCEFRRCSVWGYDKILAADLVSPTRSLIYDDKLKIHCRIWVEGEIKHTLGKGGAVLHEPIDAESKKQRLELLQSDFKEILFDNSFADVALITNTKTFMAHKAILAARSRVFKGIFNSQVLSSNESVEISNFDAGVVKAMLEYIYTGETFSLMERANDLLQIAETYGLDRLKQDCGIAISAKLTIENCAETLVFAHLQNAIALKRKVVKFINRNKNDVIKTTSFQRLKSSHPMVFVDLYLAQ